MCISILDCQSLDLLPPAMFLLGHVPLFTKRCQVASSSKSAQIWAQRKVEQLSQAQLCDMLISVHPKQLFEDEVRPLGDVMGGDLKDGAGDQCG